MSYQYQFHIRLDMFLQIYDTNLLFSPVLDSLKKKWYLKTHIYCYQKTLVNKSRRMIQNKTLSSNWAGLGSQLDVFNNVKSNQLTSLKIIFMLLLNPSRFLQILHYYYNIIYTNITNIHIIWFMKTKDKHAFCMNLIFFFRFRF